MMQKSAKRQKVSRTQVCRDKAACRRHSLFCLGVALWRKAAVLRHRIVTERGGGRLRCCELEFPAQCQEVTQPRNRLGC